MDRAFPVLTVHMSPFPPPCCSKPAAKAQLAAPRTPARSPSPAPTTRTNRVETAPAPTPSPVTAHLTRAAGSVISAVKPWLPWNWRLQVPAGRRVVPLKQRWWDIGYLVFFFINLTFVTYIVDFESLVGEYGCPCGKERVFWRGGGGLGWVRPQLCHHHHHPAA
jgi:hypothetical protein